VRARRGAGAHTIRVIRRLTLTPGPTAGRVRGGAEVRAARWACSSRARAVWPAGSACARLKVQTLRHSGSS